MTFIILVNYDYIFDDAPTTSYDIKLFELLVTGIVNNNGIHNRLVDV